MTAPGSIDRPHQRTNLLGWPPSSDLLGTSGCRDFTCPGTTLKGQRLSFPWADAPVDSVSSRSSKERVQRFWWRWLLVPLLNCWRSRIEVVLEVETRDVTVNISNMKMYHYDYNCWFFVLIKTWGPSLSLHFQHWATLNIFTSTYRL